MNTNTKQPGTFAGSIVRQKDPDNLEYPFTSLDGLFTPNELFYVRSHFERPEVDPQNWRLTVTGAVERVLEIGYDELRRMPCRTEPALLECSGNSRVFLEPPQSGIRWELGAVSNAEWTGVPLVDLLARAGVKETAVEVVLSGADQGTFEEPDPPTPGRISYARSLPLAKARQPQVLLAYKMNGQNLPPEHGFPVRAVVPGWYGMASVKWLRSIEVTERAYHGYFQTLMYAIWERRGELPDLVPVGEIQVKAEIARPVLHEVVPAGASCRIFGAAWTGEGIVSRVDLSTDGGSTWSPARLTSEPIPYVWRLWEYDWTPTERAPHTLMARATDDRGREQPLERNKDRRDAVISHVLPVEVFVS